MVATACSATDAPTEPAATPDGSTAVTDLVEWATVPAPLHPSVDGYPAATVDLVAPDDTTHRIAVRVAATPAQRQHGLMEVPDVPDGTGMVFLFDADRTGGFWMRNTLVALDIVYVRADGSVADVQRMEPCTTPDCPTYPPDEPYRHALEVRAGFLGDIGFAADWTVDVAGIVG